MDKIKDIHRIAKEIKGLSHFPSTISRWDSLATIRRLSGKIMLICEDLEEKGDSNVSRQKNKQRKNKRRESAGNYRKKKFEG